MRTLVALGRRISELFEVWDWYPEAALGALPFKMNRVVVPAPALDAAPQATRGAREVGGGLPACCAFRFEQSPPPFAPLPRQGRRKHFPFLAVRRFHLRLFGFSQ